jgi:hypothetical protein
MAHVSLRSTQRVTHGADGTEADKGRLRAGSIDKFLHRSGISGHGGRPLGVAR